MTDLPELAVEVAESMREDGAPALTRPALYRRVKDEADADELDHAAVRAALDDAGWDYGRHLYVHREGIVERIDEIATSFRESGRLLVTHSEVCERVAADPERMQLEGWQKGPFVDHTVAGFDAAGWLTDTIDGADTRVYVYPLLAAIRDEHPRGRFWRSPEELFGYYLSTSVTAALSE